MAVISSAVIVGGAAVYSANRQSSAARNAANTQAAATDDAIRAQQESEARALALTAPQREAGYRATAAMMDMAGLSRGTRTTAIDNAEAPAGPAPFTPTRKGFGLVKDFMEYARTQEAAKQNPAPTDYGVPNLADYDQYEYQQDPGYQFRMDESMRVLERGAAARGGLLSGGYGRSAIRYAQEYASNEYQNIFERISRIAGYGSSSAAQGAQTIVNTGANVGSALIKAGEARGSGYIAQGNANSNMIGQLGQLGGYAAQWYQSRGNSFTPMGLGEGE